MSSDPVVTITPDPADPARDVPRNRRQEETFRKVLTAGVDVLRETSYADLTVRAVAARAKVAPATAYTYFKTKESLRAQAVLTFVASNDFPSFGVAFAQTADAETRVQAVVEASDKSIRLHEAQYRALLRSSLEDGQGDELPRRKTVVVG